MLFPRDSSSLMTVMFACYGAGVFLIWYHRKLLLEFLSEVPEIRSSTDLRLLQQVVTSQMYGALLLIVLLVVPVGVYLYGIFIRTFGIMHLPLTVVPSILLSVLSSHLKSIEQKVYDIRTADPQLQSQVDHIIHVYRTKPFPDWD